MEYYDTSHLFVAAELRARRKIRIYPVIKHALETILALTLLMLLVPLFLLLAIAIRLDSPGPVLFRQKRIGKKGRPFTFYKFRSMHVNIDRDSHQAFLKAYVNGNVPKGADDPAIFKPIQAYQVTTVGKLLRKTSLDELPQLFNIIKGDMSFIGPRPNVSAEVEEYKDWHTRRLEVLPGITGWAQINGRSSLSFDQIVRYDLEYIENQSLLFDLRILWQTVPLVLRARGAR